MKSLFTSDWLRRSGVVLAGAALSLSVVSMWAIPALSSSQRERLAEKMLVLQASRERWIEINITTQRLVAWEGGSPIYAVIISTGRGSTPTRPGIFAIQSKQRYSRMRGRDYDVLNVPHAMYYSGGYAIHGAFWHRRFGTPVGHGCVNVAPNHAQWLFSWATVGTPVVIHQ